MAWPGAQAERPWTPGRGSGAAGALAWGRLPVGLLEGCPAIPPGQHPCRAHPVPSEPRPLPEGAPLLCWPPPPAPRGPRGQSWEQDRLTGHTQEFSHPLCFRVSLEPEVRMPTAPPEKHQRKPDVHTRQRDHRPRGVETGLGWPEGKPARHWLPVKPECHICLSPSSLIFQMKMPPPLTRGMKISPAID